jgi:hypothetical protein
VDGDTVPLQPIVVPMRLAVQYSVARQHRHRPHRHSPQRAWFQVSNEGWRRSAEAQVPSGRLTWAGAFGGRQPGMVWEKNIMIKKDMEKIK